MSRIDELIKDLCPDGVHFLPLWRLTTWDKKFNAVDRAKQPKVLKYRYLLANEITPLIRVGGDVKLLTTNTSDLWTTEELAGESMQIGEIIAIPWGGNPNVQYYKGKFVTTDNRIAVANDPSVLDMKYLYYFLTRNINTLASFYRGSGIKHPSMAQVLDLRIPVPPLEVQREIVRILDQFTQLEAELEAELEARFQQYAHYRNELLTFTEGAHYVTLGDLCSSISTGKLDVNAKVEGGKYPFFTCDAKPYSIDTWKFDTEAIILSGNGSRVGHVSYYHGKFNAYQRTYIVTDFSPQVAVPYLLHYLSAFFRDYVSIKSKKGSVPYITLPMLKTFSVPLPSLDQQNRIVQILNSFDALVNDLSVGLPAEIAARRKQYEHYRDRLLTFNEATV